MGIVSSTIISMMTFSKFGPLLFVVLLCVNAAFACEPAPPPPQCQTKEGRNCVLPFTHKSPVITNEQTWHGCAILLGEDCDPSADLTGACAARQQQSIQDALAFPPVRKCWDGTSHSDGSKVYKECKFWLDGGNCKYILQNIPDIFTIIDQLIQLLGSGKKMKPVEK